MSVCFLFFFHLKSLSTHFVFTRHQKLFVLFYTIKWKWKIIKSFSGLVLTSDRFLAQIKKLAIQNDRHLAEFKNQMSVKI